MSQHRSPVVRIHCLLLLSPWDVQISGLQELTLKGTSATAGGILFFENTPDSGNR